MDVAAHQKALLAEDHLKSQIDAWNHVKPFFDEIAKDISPPALPFFLKSLTQYKNQIKNAKKEFFVPYKYLSKVCKVEQIPEEAYGIPNMRELDTKARGVLSAINVLQLKFEGKQTIPFKKLPYEFQARLMDLLPRRDLVYFKVAGKFNISGIKGRRQGLFSHSLIVVDSKDKYEDKKTRFANTNFDIVSVTTFLKSENCYVQHGLYLDLDSTEDFDDVVTSITGEYVFLELSGSYTWRHAINLMYRSSKLSTVTLNGSIQLDLVDFEEFFEAVAQWLYKRRPYMLEIGCSHLNDIFQPFFKDYIETETQFDAYLYDSKVVVCMQPWFQTENFQPQDSVSLFDLFYGLNYLKTFVFTLGSFALQYADLTMTFPRQ